MARLRRKGRTSEPERDSVALDGEDHAWWTQGRVNHAPGVTTADPDDAEESTDERSFFDDWSTDSLFAMPSEGTPKDDPPATALFAADQAYVLFGLAEDATWEDVVRAHRKLAKRYHPDALINEPPEVRSKGEERMRELNVAYESLRRTFHPPTRSLF